MTEWGRRETMPMVMMSETPLPMPRSVICSPSHMKTMVVQVRTTVLTSTKTVLLPIKRGPPGFWSPIREGSIMATATMTPWIRQTRIVR